MNASQGLNVQGPLAQLLMGGQQGINAALNPPLPPAYGHQQPQNPALGLGQHGLAFDQVPGLQHGGMVQMGAGQQVLGAMGFGQQDPALQQVPGLPGAMVGIGAGQQELQELPVGPDAAAAAANAVLAMAAEMQQGNPAQPGHDAAELQQINAGAGQQPVTEAEMQQAWTQAAEAIETAHRAAAVAAGQPYGQVYVGLADFVQQHNAAQQNKQMFRTVENGGGLFINGVLHQHGETWVFHE